jgi:hypothetical protein
LLQSWIGQHHRCKSRPLGQQICGNFRFGADAFLGCPDTSVERGRPLYTLAAFYPMIDIIRH